MSQMMFGVSGAARTVIATDALSPHSWAVSAEWEQRIAWLNALPRNMRTATRGVVLLLTDHAGNQAPGVVGSDGVARIHTVAGSMQHGMVMHAVNWRHLDDPSP